MSDPAQDPMEGRCGAGTRAGTPCRRWPMPNGRCRLHGGCSTGPRTAEGMARLRAARTVHGSRSAEAREFRALVRALDDETAALRERV